MVAGIVVESDEVKRTNGNVSNKSDESPALLMRIVGNHITPERRLESLHRKTWLTMMLLLEHISKLKKHDQGYRTATELRSRSTRYLTTISPLQVPLLVPTSSSVLGVVQMCCLSKTL